MYLPNVKYTFVILDMVGKGREWLTRSTKSCLLHEFFLMLEMLRQSFQHSGKCLHVGLEKHKGKSPFTQLMFIVHSLITAARQNPILVKYVVVGFLFFFCQYVMTSWYK